MFKLRFLLFQLQDEPIYPPGVCLGCTTTALAAQEFKTFVHKSRSLWNNTINILESELPRSTPSSKSIFAFLDDDCQTMLVLNNSGAQGSPKTILEQLLTQPQKTKTKGRQNQKPRVNRSYGGPCECVDCGSTFSSPYYLHAHLLNSGQKEACLICGAVLSRGQDIKNHHSLIHKRQVYPCDSCPAWFEKEPEFKRHKETAHKPGALTCGDCGRTFLRASVLEAHSQMHRVRTCRHCGKQFTNRSCYRKHRSGCEPDAKPDAKTLPRYQRSNIRDPALFICDYCDKKYHSRPQLKNHILWIHLDVRPHQCGWCDKRFFTPARLKEHERVHTRVRDFECDICGAKLVSKAAAIYHRRRHTGEKPYACDYCDEKFISASRRSEHAKRRHNKGNMRVCPHCPSSFVRRLELKKHMEKAHKAEKKMTSQLLEPTLGMFKSETVQVA